VVFLSMRSQMRLLECCAAGMMYLYLRACGTCGVYTWCGVGWCSDQLW
jgi:hypothetical protein